MQSRRLEGQERQLAKMFLYRIYVKALGWTPNQGNASGLKVIPDISKPRIEDDFDDGAIWFGVFDDKRIVAVARLLYPVEGKLEIERYQQLPEKKIFRNPTEFNRFALEHSYIETNAALLLFMEMANFCLTNKIDAVFTAATSPYPLDLSIRVGFRKLSSAPFKYFETDKEFAHLAVLDCRDGTALVRIIDVCSSLLK